MNLYNLLDETYKKYFEKLENEKDFDKITILLDVLADLNLIMDHTKIFWQTLFQSQKSFPSTYRAQ